MTGRRVVPTGPVVGPVEVRSHDARDYDAAVLLLADGTARVVRDGKTTAFVVVPQPVRRFALGLPVGGDDA